MSSTEILSKFTDAALAERRTVLSATINAGGLKRLMTDGYIAENFYAAQIAMIDDELKRRAPNKGAQ